MPNLFIFNLASKILVSKSQGATNCRMLKKIVSPLEPMCDKLSHVGCLDLTSEINRTLDVGTMLAIEVRE